MHFTALSTALLAILHNAIAAPVDSHRPSLDVTLTRVGNTHIKAMVKNTGSEDVTFVHLNWFHDNAPVPKVSVHRNGTEVQFQGIRRRYRLDGLTSEALTSLAAGDSFEDEFDIASTSDLSEGGTVSLKSHGFVPIVTDGKITGAIPYNSNELSIDVDAAEASTVMKAIAPPLDRRTKTAQCSGSKGSALSQALRNSANLANKAADAATSGSASKFQEYFKTTSSSTRQTVAARLRAVAKESSSSSSGATTYYCSDAYGYCSSNVLAYTLPAYNIIANCDIYYSYLPPLAGTCHAQDQATTTLHEFTHAPGVYSPGTEDYGYGYQAATSLSANQALNNADSYALYANAIHLGC